MYILPWLEEDFVTVCTVVEGNKKKTTEVLHLPLEFFFVKMKMEYDDKLSMFHLLMA